MLLSVGAWFLTSISLLIIFALVNLESWCVLIAIAIPGAISVPIGLHAISKHEDVQTMCEEQDNYAMQDVSYERVPGYVRIFRGSPIPEDIDGTFSVYSELFGTYGEAARFANVFQHNYFTAAVVQETSDGMFFVECKNAEMRLLGTEFIENPDTCLIENLENPFRGPEKAAEYFNIKNCKEKTSRGEKKMRHVRYAIFAIIWVTALTLILTSEQKSLAAFIVVPVFAIFSYYVLSKKHGIIKNQSYSFSYIDQMDGETFERFVGNMLVRRKYGSVRYTPVTGDFGVDIILNGHVAIQCKRSSKNLGIKPIQEVYTGMNHYGCNSAIVVTNAHFTKNAIQLANELNIALWDRNTLSGMM